jgi:hypothetical protein
MEGLRQCGWNAHQCSHHADTHIGELCTESPDKDEFVVVTRDSDMMVYEGIEQLVMPIGRRHELTLFKKSDLLSSLQLPSERHLMVASLVTKNDYADGIKWYGVKRNVEVVRSMDIEPGPRVQSVTTAVEAYLSQVKHRGKTVADFQHAITAFAACKEEGSDQDTPSTNSSHDVHHLLRRLEFYTLERTRETGEYELP